MSPRQYREAFNNHLQLLAQNNKLTKSNVQNLIKHYKNGLQQGTIPQNSDVENLLQKAHKAAR